LESGHWRACLGLPAEVDVGRQRPRTSCWALEAAPAVAALADRGGRAVAGVPGVPERVPLVPGDRAAVGRDRAQVPGAALVALDGVVVVEGPVRAASGIVLDLYLGVGTGPAGAVDHAADRARVLAVHQGVARTPLGVERRPVGRVRDHPDGQVGRARRGVLHRVLVGVDQQGVARRVRVAVGVGVGVGVAVGVGVGVGVRVRVAVRVGVRVGVALGRAVVVVVVVVVAVVVLLPLAGLGQIRAAGDRAADGDDDHERDEGEELLHGSTPGGLYFKAGEGAPRAPWGAWRRFHTQTDGHLSEHETISQIGCFVNS